MMRRIAPGRAGRYHAAMPQTYYFNPRLALWWLKLQQLPEHLRLVDLLHAATCPRLPATQYQQMHAVPTTVACLEGVVRIRSRQRQVDLHPGDMVVIAPGAWHVHEQLKAGSLVFAQGLIAGCSDILLADPDLYISGRLPEEPYSNLFYQVLATDDHQRQTTLLVEGIEQIARETVLPLVEQPPAVRKMLAALWSNLHRPIDADFLVRASGVSRAQAYRLFTDAFGESPHRTLTKQRLLLSEHLLREGIDITTVAKRAGFSDRAAYTRSFRRHYGMPPSQWLQTHAT